jgi:hypothetical protein
MPTRFRDPSRLLLGTHRAFEDLANGGRGFGTGAGEGSGARETRLRLIARIRRDDRPYEDRA